MAKPSYSMSVITEKMVCRKENNVFLANVMFLIFILQVFTSFRNPCLHNQLHHKPHYVLDIADVMPDSISGFDLFSRT